MLQGLRGRWYVQRLGKACKVDAAHAAHADQEPQRPGQHLQLLLHLLAGGRVSLVFRIKEVSCYCQMITLSLGFMIQPGVLVGQQPPEETPPWAHICGDPSAAPGILSVWPQAQSGTQ